MVKKSLMSAARFGLAGLRDKIEDLVHSGHVTVGKTTEPLNSATISVLKQELEKWPAITSEAGPVPQTEA